MEDHIQQNPEQKDAPHEHNIPMEINDNPMEKLQQDDQQAIENEQGLTFNTRIQTAPVKEKLTALREEIKKVIVGQQKMLDLMLVGLLADGHLLLEGVPGVAKTITAKLLARSMDTAFSRIQFTPDLMPSDILGTLVFDTKKSDFEYKKGPVFSNIVLIDEINRAPAKTQAALFEVMEERQVTMDGHTYPMSLPFMVIATQNPIEQEGTYRLPEAQLDRFIMKIEIGYPDLNEEIEILQREHSLKSKGKLDDITPIISGDDILAFRNIIKDVIAEAPILAYIAKVVNSTRNNPLLYLGASPRASIAILNASKALAALRGRDFVTPDDVKEISYPVLGHRVVVAPEKEMEGITAKLIIKQIVDSVEVPR
jgi:MoxR-like ATPase